LEDKLQLNEQAIKHCDVLLFYDPMNKEAHQAKLKLLKRLRNYQYISEYLIESNKVCPFAGLNNMNLRDKFQF
jgi:hypothetical protein